MDKNIRKIQLAILDIAKEIKRICEENKITYFLDSGSLLGAVRHHGFIPWDDDMDIGMLRPDYDKFIRIAPEKLGHDFFLQTWETDSNYPFAFAKVRKIGTLFVEKSSQNSAQIHKELWIDVFPYDVYPDDESDRRRQGKRIMLYRYAMWMKCGYKPWLNHDSLIEQMLVRMKYIPSKIYGFFCPKERLIARYDMAMRRFNHVKSQFYFEQSGSAPYGKCLIPTEAAHELIMADFEDDKFPIPSRYDEILSLLYGDYMKLPPENQRGRQHQIVEVKV